ncbi:APC family permease [Thermoproteota archaeon]
MVKKEATLKRSISLALLTFYGLGTIVGAGIYVLVGEVAGRAGMFTPIAFLLSAIIAAFTGISYAELSARYPKSAGEAIYAKKGFNNVHFSTLIGLLIVLTGVTSSATLMRGFTGYFQIFFNIPTWVIIVVGVLILGIVAAWGIIESLTAAMIITVIEIGGILLVVWSARASFLTLPSRLPEMLPGFGGGAWLGIMLGSFIAFFAFIGFEDMVNIAEEVKRPKRNLPLGIFIALGGATILYMLVATVAVLALPLDQLAASTTPLAEIYTQSTGSAPTLIAIISLFAIVNGALVQKIMCSRILYGLSAQKQLPKILSRVHPWTRTPVIATGVVVAIVLVLALWLPLVTLAKVASTVILIVYATLNLALVRIKLKYPNPEEVRTYHISVPIIGFILCTAFVLFQLVSVLI